MVSSTRWHEYFETISGCTISRSLVTYLQTLLHPCNVFITLCSIIFFTSMSAKRLHSALFSASVPHVSLTPFVFSTFWLCSWISMSIYLECLLLLFLYCHYHYYVFLNRGHSYIRPTSRSGVGGCLKLDNFSISVLWQKCYRGVGILIIGEINVT